MKSSSVAFETENMLKEIIIYKTLHLLLNVELQ